MTKEIQVTQFQLGPSFERRGSNAIKLLRDGARMLSGHDDLAVIARELSELSEITQSELLGGYRMLVDGFTTVEQACPKPDEVRDAMSHVMAEVVREFTDADCVFVRQCRTDGSLEVVGRPVWRAGVEVGSPPRVKLRGEGVSGWAIEQSIDEPLVVADLNDPNLPPELRAAHQNTVHRHALDESEKAFVDFIQAEACVPIIMCGRAAGAVVAVRGTPYEQQHADRVKRLLKSFKVILRSLFMVGWVLHDFHRTNYRMQRLSRILPLVAMADSNELFLRQMATLLTCHCGLGWHRAMVFAFDDGYPSDARCVLALGGTGEPCWSKRHEDLAGDTIQELLDQCRRADFAIEDPLFQAMRESSRIIPRHHFEAHAGLNRLFTAPSQHEKPDFSEEANWFDEGVWMFTPDDSWLKDNSSIAFAFEGVAAECEHFLVPLNWIDSTESGRHYRTPGFVLLDNPYVHTGDLHRQMPLTRMFCNVFAGYFDARIAGSTCHSDEWQCEDGKDETGGTPLLTEDEELENIPLVTMERSSSTFTSNPGEGRMPHKRSGGMPTLGLNIVRVVQAYGDIPIGFLSKHLGRSRSEICEVVDALQTRNVIRISNQLVSLTSEEQHRAPSNDSSS